MKYTFKLDGRLNKNKFPGFYVALEGIDGCGKSTQLTILKDYFEKLGNEVVTTREPRKEAGVVAELNKKILEGRLSIPRAAFQYLFTADRIIHLEELVVPALKKGKVVITDRCFWSAVPYGAVDVDKHFNQKKAESLLVAQGIIANHYSVLVPNITLYLKVSVETSFKRMGKMSKNKEVYENKEVLTQVVKGYDWLIKKFPKEFVALDAEKPIDEVTGSMIKVITRL